MTLNQVKPENVNTEIKITGEILNPDKPEPKIETAVYECKSCMRTYEVKQNTIKGLYEPAVCQECGGKEFKLLEEESRYTELQRINVSSGDSQLIVYLRGTLCNYDYKFLDHVIAYGILRVMLNDADPNYYYLEATACNKRRK